MSGVARRALPIASWPAADQTAWRFLVQPGDMFDVGGFGADWRPATARNLAQCYGHWLGFLTEWFSEMLTMSPADRATAERIRTWLDSMDDLAPGTLYLRVQGMARVLKAFPESAGRDWAWLERTVRRLRLRAERHDTGRKAGRIFCSDELLEVGLTAFEAAMANDDLSPVTQAVKARDGLIIAMLATRPVRVRNFTVLEIGWTLVETADGFHITLPADETKTHHAFEMPVPDSLTGSVRCWINTLRPRLLARSGLSTARLWIGREGRPMSDKVMAARISTVTKQLLGVDVCPHMFRDALATTIARSAPETTQSIKALLGHSTLATAERHYNQAKGAEASQSLSELIENRRSQRHRDGPFSRAR